MRQFKRIVRRLTNSLSYEIDRKMAPASLEGIKLALAYYSKAKPGFSLVQVGACDGVAGDPVFEFINREPIHAILVEPIESSFLKLKKSYADLPNVECLQAAIAEEDGVSTIYKVKESGRWADSEWAPQWASFNRQHLIKQGVKSDEIEEVTVPCMTLGSLMAKFNLDQIDFLQVDTEGYDAVVVEMALNLSIVPGFINFENLHVKQKPKISERLFCKLSEAGYTWIHDEYNTLAVHNRLTNLWK